MPTLAVTGNADAELIHAKLLAEAGAEKTALLTDFQPPVNLDPAPGLDLEAFGACEAGGDFKGPDTAHRVPVAARGKQQLDGVRKAHEGPGKPLLANDPQFADGDSFAAVRGASGGRRGGT